MDKETILKAINLLAKVERLEKDLDFCKKHIDKCQDPLSATYSQPFMRLLKKTNYEEVVKKEIESLNKLISQI